MTKHYFMGSGGSTKGVDPEKDANVTVVGVSASGKVSKNGTVTTTEHWDGSVDANVEPNPVSASIGVREKG